MIEVLLEGQTTWEAVGRTIGLHITPQIDVDLILEF